MYGMAKGVSADELGRSGDEHAQGGKSEGEKKRMKPRWVDIHFN